MYSLILKRLFWAVPTLLAITMLAFALSKAAPGDPVVLLLDRTGDAPGGDPKRAAQAYKETARILGLDLPVFYCAFLPGHTQVHGRGNRPERAPGLDTCRYFTGMEQIISTIAG